MGEKQLYAGGDPVATNRPSALGATFDEGGTNEAGVDLQYVSDGSVHSFPITTSREICIGLTLCFDGKYSSPTDTPLTCEVKGTTVFDIEVEKPE